MARITVPEGAGGELVQVWGLSPELGAAVGNLSAAVYGERLVPPRVREVARMKIAQINGCNVCMDWRFPELAERGVDEALYDNVADPDAGGYSAQELLAIEYAEKFALDHRSIDDPFFDRMKAEFSDAEILELTAMIGDWLAFGRLNAVLDIAEACAWSPPAHADSTSGATQP
jgi:AhpD family alkylhydroperoxidase